MKRLVQLMAVAALAASGSGCAVLGGVMRGEGVGALSHTGEDVRAGVEAGEEAKRKCGPIAEREVPYKEETMMGGAVALALAQKTRGVYVELSPELVSVKGNPDPAAFAYKKPAPATGDKTELTRYLNVLGKGLAAFSSRPTIDWTFVVLDSDTPNAFSAPGGYVFITTAMLKALDNEAQLAGVLAHEIGHVTHRHALKGYKDQKVAACIAGSVGSSAVKSGLANAAGGSLADQMMGANGFDLDKAAGDLIAKLTDGVADWFINTGFGGEKEKESDATVVELMLFAGYDVDQYVALLRKLPDGAMLSPHPTNASRIATIEDIKKTEYAGFDFASLKAPPSSDKLKVLKAVSGLEPLGPVGAQP